MKFIHLTELDEFGDAFNVVYVSSNCISHIRSEVHGVWKKEVTSIHFLSEYCIYVTSTPSEVIDLINNF